MKYTYQPDVHWKDSLGWSLLPVALYALLAVSPGLVGALHAADR